MTERDSTLEELKKITKILTLAHGKAIQEEIEKIATTDERKKIWVLIDGVKTSKNIAKEVGVTVRSVDIFLKMASTASLVENPWGKPPCRTIDYVPPKWVELLKIPEEESEKKKEGTT